MVLFTPTGISPGSCDCDKLGLADAYQQGGVRAGIDRGDGGGYHTAPGFDWNHRVLSKVEKASLSTIRFVYIQLAWHSNYKYTQQGEGTIQLYNKSREAQ